MKMQIRSKTNGMACPLKSRFSRRGSVGGGPSTFDKFASFMGGALRTSGGLPSPSLDLVADDNTWR